MRQVPKSRELPHCKAPLSAPSTLHAWSDSWDASGTEDSALGAVWVWGCREGSPSDQAGNVSAISCVCDQTPGQGNTANS